MIDNICSAEEAEPPGMTPATLIRANAIETQLSEHNILPDINRSKLMSLTRVPVNRQLPENPQSSKFSSTILSGNHRYPMEQLALATSESNYNGWVDWNESSVFQTMNALP